MNKSILAFSFVTILFAFQSCHKISGSGPSVTRSYNYSDFTSVYAGLDGGVYYTQGSTYKVEIHAQTNILDKIEAHINNGELQLGFEKFRNIGNHDRVIVYITAPWLSGLGINGSGNLYALQPINGNNLSLKVNGSGNINITQYTGQSLSADISGSGNISVNGGAVNSEDLHISGSGTLDLLGITALDVSSSTTGSGTTSVNALNSLRVRISGSGDVFFTGYPSVNSNISGSGKVKHI